MNNNEQILLINKYSLQEEIANSITHGIGIVLCLIFTAVLLVSAYCTKNISAFIGFAIYGVCSTTSYVTSTLYHSCRIEKIKKVLRVIDHSAIYLFIAGTYTPIALLTLNGWQKYFLLISVWILAVIGVSITLLSKKDLERSKKISLFLYVAMGWMVVFVIRSLLDSVDLMFFVWLLVGGISYTVGVIFYVNKKIPFSHAIWHLFVLGGSVFQFIGIFLYLK